MMVSKKTLVMILIIVGLLVLFSFHAKAKYMSEPINENEPGGSNIVSSPTFAGVPGTKNFNLSEFHCKDGTKVPQIYYPNLQRLLVNLQVLRESLGVPIIVNSGYRSPEHNNRVGGKPGSMHLQAAAADIVAIGFTSEHVRDRIKQLIASGDMQDGGIGSYSNFTHYDVGPVRRW